MRSVQVKLVKTSICDCGYTVLYEHIQPGTMYTIYPVTIRDKWVYKCGKCGKVQKNITIVDANQILNPDRAPAPLPLELFDYREEEAV